LFSFFWFGFQKVSGLSGNLFQKKVVMNIRIKLSAVLILVVCTAFFSCGDKESDNNVPMLQLAKATMGAYTLNLSDFSKNTSAPYNNGIALSFSAPLNLASVEGNISIKEPSSSNVPVSFSYLDNNATVSIDVDLNPNTAYVVKIGALEGASGEKFPGFEFSFTTEAGELSVTALQLGDVNLTSVSRIIDVPLENTAFKIVFSDQVDPSTITTNNIVISGPLVLPLTLDISDDQKSVTVSINSKLADLRRYTISLNSSVKGAKGEALVPYTKQFYSAADPTPDFPVISDDALLTLVQQQTFKYFWDFGHPASGMARERNSSGNLITSGGSGFGLMAIIVGIERNFISRADGLARLDKMLTFLESADRFHGAWSHWIDGNTGNVIPFSSDDNGGDLVETSFLVQGLITFRQYLDSGIPLEQELIDRINTLWKGVEWDWYRKNNEQVLYWHWSPDKNWVMNMQIRGHNETLITYVLAASSPTHTIDASVYTNGYARNGGMKNGNPYYSIPLPLGEPYGGPLFFAHYSFLGLDPRNLEDTYANYWVQNVNHSLINHAYSADNPKTYAGYSDESWGLTASDNNNGYNAHSPTNDLGVITPTAALSSFPYTPEESMKALHFFYYSIGDRLWGEYGFYDAYNITAQWTANSYLAIDEGPIIVMIENHRTGLLWDLFMSATEIQDGLTKLGFNY
jgi:hypothetical protein